MQTFVYKVILLGNSGVGKTTLFRKIRSGNEEIGRDKSLTDSIDLAPCTLEFMMSETVKVKLEVSDTGSIEKFRGSFPTNYFRFSHGVILVYDVSNLTSLYDLEEWISDAQQKTAEDPGIIYTMIGNKTDLSEVDTTSSEGEMFGARHGILESLQFRISIQKESPETLKDLFKTVAERIYTVYAQSKQETRTELSISITNPPKAAENKCFNC